MTTEDPKNLSPEMEYHVCSSQTFRTDKADFGYKVNGEKRNCYITATAHSSYIFVSGQDFDIGTSGFEVPSVAEH